MKIESGNSIYSLLIRMARKNPAVPTEKIETTVALPMQTHELLSNDERIADFYAKLTASQLELADMDHNGKVTKAEFMEGQERIAQKKADGLWSQLHASDKGWLDESELRHGLENGFKMRIGSLDAGCAERLRTRGT
jgi:hypothetical protein